MDDQKQVVSSSWFRFNLFQPRKIEYSDHDIQLDEQGHLDWSIDDVENPKNWSRGRRWFITAVCIAVLVNGSMASSSPSACIPSIMQELGVSAEVAKLNVTLFVLGFCTGPSIWAPLSEYYGRRQIFILTFVAYFAFTWLCAFSPNIEGLLVGRFLCGTFISGALSNTPGVFADLWGPIERGNCMTLFTCSLQMGPAIGPVTSGFYQLKLTYHWTFYQLLWMAGFCLILVPMIPETLPSRALLNKARRIRAARIPGFEHVQAPVETDGKSLVQIFKVALLRPWSILMDPIAGMLALYMTLVYTLLYMLFTIFPIAFIDVRGWNAGVGELPLLSVCVGAIFGGSYIYWDSVRRRRKIAAGHQPCPEDSLTIGLVGSVLFPAGMFLFSWTAADTSIHWIVPCIGGVILAVAITVLFVASLSYLSESYLMYAASAQAGNTIIRSGVAAAAPLYTEQMFHKLTVGGGGSLIAGIAVLLMPVFFVFYRYGARIRARSKYAPTPVLSHKKSQVSSGEDLNDHHGSNSHSDDEEKPKSDAGSLKSEQASHNNDDNRFVDMDRSEKGGAGLPLTRLVPVLSRDSRS